MTTDAGYPDRLSDPYGWALAQSVLLAENSALFRQVDGNGLREFLEEAAADLLFRANMDLVDLLAHGAVAAADPAVAGPWRTRCAESHDRLVETYRPSMQPRIDVDRLWRRATRKAQAMLADAGRPEAQLPRACPVDLEFLLDPALDFERLASEIGTQGEGRQ